MTSPPVHNRTENHGAALHIHDIIFRSSSQPRPDMAEFVTTGLLTHSAKLFSSARPSADAEAIIPVRWSPAH